MVSRMSPRYLSAALVVGFALSFTPTAPVLAADYPSLQAPRGSVAPARVRVAKRVRQVAVDDGYGCGHCALPVAAPYYWAVRYARYRAHHCDCRHHYH